MTKTCAKCSSPAAHDVTVDGNERIPLCGPCHDFTQAIYTILVAKHDDLVASGMTPDEAEAQLIRQMQA